MFQPILDCLFHPLHWEAAMHSHTSFGNHRSDILPANPPQGGIVTSYLPRTHIQWVKLMYQNVIFYNDISNQDFF